MPENTSLFKARSGRQSPLPVGVKFGYLHDNAHDDILLKIGNVNLSDPQTAISEILAAYQDGEEGQLLAALNYVAGGAIILNAKNNGDPFAVFNYDNSFVGGSYAYDSLSSNIYTIDGDTVGTFQYGKFD